MKVSTCILAGGKSRRFKKDMLFQIFRGKTLIENVIRAAGISDDVFIVGKPAFKFLYLSARFIPESYLDQAPIYGIATGLRAAKYSKVLFLPGDIPLLKTDVVKFLSELQPPSVLTENGKLHSLMCVLSKLNLPTVEEMIGKKELALYKLHEKLKSRKNSFKRIAHLDYSKSSLKNINTQEELREAIN